jgi:glycosyltransferase involved in cell wall biosynthesis
VYNEEATIERALTETAATFRAFDQPFEIIVVNDGSTDRTAPLLGSMLQRVPSLRILTHDTNRGKGAAVRTGALSAVGEVVLFLDCDLSTHPDVFRAFIPLLEHNDIVIGSRRVPGAMIAEPQPFWRVWLGVAFNTAVRTYLRLPYRDTQCGFKAVKCGALPVLRSIKSNGWTFDVELLARARSAGFSIVECPVTWSNRRESRVRLGSAWNIFKELREIKHAVQTDR